METRSHLNFSEQPVRVIRIQNPATEYRFSARESLDAVWRLSQKRNYEHIKKTYLTEIKRKTHRKTHKHRETHSKDNHVGPLNI